MVEGRFPLLGRHQNLRCLGITHQLGLQVCYGSIAVAGDHVETAATPDLTRRTLLKWTVRSIAHTLCERLRAVDVSGSDDLGVNSAAVRKGFDLVDTITSTLRDLPC